MANLDKQEGWYIISNDVILDGPYDDFDEIEQALVDVMNDPEYTLTKTIEPKYLSLTDLEEYEIVQCTDHLCGLGKVTSGDRELYFWQLGKSHPFNELLFELISKSDKHNMDKLHLAFPDQVEAYIRYINEEHYWSKLQKFMTKKT